LFLSARFCFSHGFAASEIWADVARFAGGIYERAQKEGDGECSV